MEKIIDRGAEAILVLKDGELIKKRVKKNYRIKEIDDKLRRRRNRIEARNIERVSSVINVPKIFKIDEKEKNIYMEYIKGKRLSEVFNGMPWEQQKQICDKIGESVGKIHDQNVVHGDLTTSNMILKEKEIYFIDFGLSFYSKRREDKAVDLHLLKQALEAKHFQNWNKLYKEILKEYKPKEKSNILKHLKKVEKRGRHKH